MVAFWWNCVYAGCSVMFSGALVFISGLRPLLNDVDYVFWGAMVIAGGALFGLVSLVCVAYAEGLLE